MIEFGEKLKQLREEKGMTQQSMAEMLYVTRQAVSRWECGARFPDLLTTKKIAKILDVTIDELVSGEELKENIEKEPVLAQKNENAVQIVMYTVIAAANLLMLLVGVFVYFDSYMQSSACSLTILDVNTGLERLVTFFVALAGIYLSSKDKMTARMTGSVMCIPYVFEVIGLFVFIAYFCSSGSSGELVKNSWTLGLVIPVLSSAYILGYFFQKEPRLPYWIMVIICLYSIGMQARMIVEQLISVYTYGLTEPISVFTSSMVGTMSTVMMACLLGYQAYKWDRKKRSAIDKSGIEHGGNWNAEKV